MVIKNPHKYNILLVDDYPPVRRIVKGIIEANPELQVIGELNDGRALLESLEKSSAQMVLLDLSMPNLGGFEAARLIKKDYPDIKILIVTNHRYKGYVERAISSGAEGYLLKDEMDDELLPAISSLRMGRRFISAQLSV